MLVMRAGHLAVTQNEGKRKEWLTPFSLFESIKMRDNRVFQIRLRYFILSAICLFSTTISYAGKTESKNVNVGDKFTVYATSHYYTNSVAWKWDIGILELVGSLYATSTSATFKVKKAPPASGVVIQATTYYFKNGTTSSGLNKDLDTWHIFAENNGGGGGDDPGNTPDTPTEKQIELSTTEISILEGEVADIKVNRSFGEKITWQIANTSIAKGTSTNNGWTLKVEGIKSGTTWAYASDAGGGKASCKITVQQRTFTNGDWFRYPADEYDKLLFTVTDAAKKECELSAVGDSYERINGTISIPEKVYGLSVVSIGSLYNHAKDIKKVILPNTIREIGNDAFYKWALEEINLPANLKKIGDYAFANTNLTSIVIPEGVESLGSRCFYSCPSLRSVALPGTLNTISEECFMDCRQLKDVTLTEGIKKIDFGAFGRTNIYHFNLPNSIEEIVNLSLGIPSLIAVTCASEVPCILEQGAIGKELTSLYVPEQSIELYKKADEWGDFKTIKAIGDIEKSLYILQPHEFYDNLEEVTAKINLNKDTPENSYTGTLNLAKGINEFVIADFDGKEVHIFGTDSSQPIFTDLDLQNESIERTFSLHSEKEGNINKFKLPEEWPGGTLHISINKSKESITFTFGESTTENENPNTANNIKDFYIKGDNGSEITANFTLTVTYANENYCYVVDNDNTPSLIYGGATSYKPLDIIPAGWKGTYADSDYQPKITPTEPMPSANDTGKFNPKTYSPQEISKDMINEVIIVNNVLFLSDTPSNKENFRGTSSKEFNDFNKLNSNTLNVKTLNFRNEFLIEGVKAGVYNVKCVVATYNLIPLLYPIEYINIESGEDAINNIDMTEDDEPAYYNLHGIRVRETESGVYIRKTRDKTQKVIIK